MSELNQEIDQELVSRVLDVHPSRIWMGDIGAVAVLADPNMTLRKLGALYPSLFPAGLYEEEGIPPTAGALRRIESLEERLAESEGAGYLLRDEARRAAESELRPTALGALGEAEVGRFPLSLADRYASRPVTRVVSAEGYVDRRLPAPTAPGFAVPTPYVRGTGGALQAGMTYVVEYDVPAPGLVSITTDYVKPGGTLSAVLRDLSRKAGYPAADGAPAVVRLQDLGDALRVLNIEGYVPV